MFEPLLKIIPPEALASIVIAAIFGTGYLFRKWFLGRLESERQKLKKLLDDAEAKRELDKIEMESRRELDKLEMQNQLDQTQSSREMLRLQNSEQVENRNAWMKVIEAMRQDGQKRDAQHDKYLGEITEAFQGMQSNTAATLELLKQHAESDEAMAIGQTKVMHQNETTHQRLIDIASSLDTVERKVESISEGRVGDRKVLDEVMAGLAEIKLSLAQFAERDLTVFDNTPPTPVVSLSATVADIAIFTQDAIDTKKEESSHD